MSQFKHPLFRLGDPLYVSQATGDLHLQPGSPCLNAAWDMNVFGVPRIGTTLTFVVNGPAGNSIYALGILDGFYPLPPYGILLAGASPFISVIELVPGLVPVNTAVAIPLPYDPSLVGLSAGIQTLTYGSPDPTKGNFTQLYRATVRR
jgi:hypothetical protein